MLLGFQFTLTTTSRQFFLLVPYKAYTKLIYSNTPGAMSGISPAFATATDQVVLKRDSGVDAKDPAVDVPYLKLVALEGQGTLAQTVYRLDTVGGQPPQSVRSCFAYGWLTAVCG
jgi:hypothetical protein